MCETNRQYFQREAVNSLPALLLLLLLPPCSLAFMLVKKALAAAAAPSPPPSPAASAAAAVDATHVSSPKGPPSGADAALLFLFFLCLLFLLEDLELPLLMCFRAKERMSSHHPRRRPTQNTAAAVRTEKTVKRTVSQAELHRRISVCKKNSCDVLLLF